MFATGKDENLKILPLGSAPKRLTLVYGQTPCFSSVSSTSGGACSGLDLYAESYILTAKLVRGIPVMMYIL
jgi:hypothetical protein